MPSKLQMLADSCSSLSAKVDAAADLYFTVEYSYLKKDGSTARAEKKVEAPTKKDAEVMVMKMMDRTLEEVKIVSSRADSSTRKDATGYVVKTIGKMRIIEGTGTYGGEWIAKGMGEEKVFKTKAQAEDHAWANQPNLREDSVKE